MLALGAMPACTLTCGDNLPTAQLDPSSDAATLFDGGPLGDGAPPLTSIDFAIGGCESLDVTGCRGTAPLELSFAPIASSPASVYLWQFGDDSSSTNVAPEHTYAHPGTYSVSLDVEGAGGGVGETKTDWITVALAPLGSACGEDNDCTSGVCVCDEGEACDAPLGGRGLCAANCSTDACAEGVCADLSAGVPSPQPWRDELCLPSCEGGCPADLACEDLRGGDDSWIRGCITPGLLAPLGSSCVDSLGNPASETCASGQCLDVGARGLCAADCSTLACPAGSECAQFAGPIGNQCLQICDDQFTCDADPWLACEMPGNPGGFSVSGPPADQGYCAPLFCGGEPTLCGPDGVCVNGACEAP